MSVPADSEFFLWTLFQQLLRRGFPLGLDEYGAAMDALSAGFGWSSRRELREVLSAIWAKSREERAVLGALLEQHLVEDWDLAAAEVRSDGGTSGDTTATPIESTPDPSTAANTQQDDTSSPPPSVTIASRTGRLPPLKLGELPSRPYTHVFLPQYPVSYRTVAQAWRRLRWPVREGPATELDVDATVRRRSRRGVASPPALRARRTNRAELLLLVDRQGSMTPFHGFVESMTDAIVQAARFRRVGLFYFHDTPLEGADTGILASLAPQLFASFDGVLADIAPLVDGSFFEDPFLRDPCAADRVLRDHARGAAVVIVSDAGAARGKHDPVRLLDTIAVLKGLKTFTNRLVWLNPVAPGAWAQNTAAQIARHIPMFPMDRDGMHRAVNVLRGQPVNLEKPLSTGYRDTASLTREAGPNA